MLKLNDRKLIKLFVLILSYIIIIFFSIIIYLLKYLLSEYSYIYDNETIYLKINI
jgi:phage shock protein PspC (stress-responsive transcriptional regulator)